MTQDLVPFHPDDPTIEVTPIRVETALSRFPIHDLSRGKVLIDIRNKEDTLAWSVSASERHGHPGPLAYKLDTLVINRRIEEAGKPIPKMVKLGSFRDICSLLGLVACGPNVRNIENALFQNAFAGITCRITYKAKDRSERTLKAGFSRYDIVLTGQTLPNGSTADAVYLLLDDLYITVLNEALTRPLDYDCLFSLPPMAQRFYEILSYQMYPAVKYQQRAKLGETRHCCSQPQSSGSGNDPAFVFPQSYLTLLLSPK